MQTVTCPNCGKEFAADSFFCPFCGEKVSGKKTEVESQVTAITWLGILLTVFVILSIGLLLSNSTDEINTGNNQEQLIQMQENLEVAEKKAEQAEKTVNFLLNNNAETFYEHNFQLNKGIIVVPAGETSTELELEAWWYDKGTVSVSSSDNKIATVSIPEKFDKATPVSINGISEGTAIITVKTTRYDHELTALVIVQGE